MCNRFRLYRAGSSVMVQIYRARVTGVVLKTATGRNWLNSPRLNVYSRSILIPLYRHLVNGGLVNGGLVNGGPVGKCMDFV